MDIDLRGAVDGRVKDIFTDDAISFVTSLQREFNAQRLRLLEKRRERQAELDAGGTLDFLPSTQNVRSGDWSVAPLPPTSRTDASR